MEIDSSGKVVNYEIFEAIIHSNHRMTYTAVNQILEDNDKELISKYQDIVPLLQNMEELAKFLIICD